MINQKAQQIKFTDPDSLVSKFHTRQNYTLLIETQA